jgi:GT2 family glycosyltransferase
VLSIIRGEAQALFSDEPDQGQHEEPLPAQWIGGSCFLFKRDVLERISLPDPHYFLTWEEVDFCLRGLRKGYPSYYVPQAKIWHKSGVSTTYSTVSLYYGIRNTFYFIKKNASPAQYYLFLSLLKAVRGGLRMEMGMNKSI